MYSVTLNEHSSIEHYGATLVCSSEDLGQKTESKGRDISSDDEQETVKV